MKLIEPELPEEKQMYKNLVDTIFKGVALAMGVAVIVVNTLGSLPTASAFTLLGIGLAALALSGLQK
jgi:hypothetical protein